MSAEDAKLKYLKDRISSKFPEILKILESDFREELDKRITILDISYEALKVNVYRGNKLSEKELNTYNVVYEKLIQVVKKACIKKTFTSLEDPEFTKVFTAKKSVGAILINGGKDNIFLVGKNFDAIRSFVTNHISNSPELKATRFGASIREIVKKEKTAAGKVITTTTKQIRSKTDIGHIPTEDNPNLQSPLESKLQQIALYSKDLGGFDPRIKNVVDNALKELYSIQADISYSFKNTAPEAIELARNVLGNGYIVVTLHTQRKNNQFAVLEKRIYDKVLYELALIASDSINFPGSNTIVQDIAQSFAYIISGKKTKKPVKHKEQKNTTKRQNISNKPINRAASGGKISLNVFAAYNANAPITSNLTNLQNLLNANLVEQVKKNMGNGTRRDVLNLQTGRFAESVEVTRLSESRQGMITAFYTYMKNPYATFSAGGRQEFPTSRDPKILISRSIREIAAEQVSNRLRSVLV